MEIVASEGASLEETEGTAEEEEDESLEAFCSSNKVTDASFRFTLEDTLGDLVAEPSPPNLFNFNLEEDLERFRLR